tara:strand:- start:170 stop:484 length:315 start_codon:yes stop_codon:yes gene_type:complete
MVETAELVVPLLVEVQQVEPQDMLLMFNLILRSIILVELFLAVAAVVAVEVRCKLLQKEKAAVLQTCSVVAVVAVVSVAELAELAELLRAVIITLMETLELLVL